MSEQVTIAQVTERLLDADNVLIISHKNPDGDTLGSAGALMWGLHARGKNVAVFCADPIHARYDYMDLKLYRNQFEVEYIVSVDIAGPQLFGDKAAKYADKVDLCIDHHASNTGYAAATFLDSTAAATAEIIFDVLMHMGVTIDKRIAKCLYTGVSTDTGCFRYANTTARSHRVAAQLIDLGAEHSMLNELHFSNKSKARIAMEQIALSNLEYHFDGVCALIYITKEQIEALGIDQGDLEGITSIPRSIEGVEVGITMRQQPGGSFKISVRTQVGIDATAIVKPLGGGGHLQAAGCELYGGLDSVRDALLKETERVLADSAAAEAEAKAAEENGDESAPSDEDKAAASAGAE